MRLLTTSLAVATALAMTACSPEEEATATVTGNLVTTAAAGASPSPRSGRVAFTSDDRTVTVTVTSTGRFSAHLPPGLWSVRGFAPNVQGELVPCSAPPRDLLLLGGQVTQQDVVCQLRR